MVRSNVSVSGPGFLRATPVAKSVKVVLSAALGMGVAAVPLAAHAQGSDELEEVVVTGTRFRPVEQTSATGLAMPLISTPQSISVITSDMLTAFNARSVYDALDMVPGVHKGGIGFGTEMVVIRGQRTQTSRLNGVAANLNSKADSFALDRVEVVRGPATVIYGSTSGFGGEINQVLKKPQEDFHTELGTRFGDFDMMRYEADITGAIPGTDDRLKARAVGAYTDYGLFQERVGGIDNTDKMFLGAVTYDFRPETSLALNAYMQSREGDQPDGCVLIQDENNDLHIAKDIPAENYYCSSPFQASTVNENDVFMGELSHTFANDWHFKAGAAYVDAMGSHPPFSYLYGPAGAFGLDQDEALLYSYDMQREWERYLVNASLGGDFDLFERTHEFFALLEYEDSKYRNRVWESFGLGVFNIYQGGLGILADGSPIPIVPTRESIDLWVDENSNSEHLRASFQVLLRATEKLEFLAGYMVHDYRQTNHLDSFFSGESSFTHSETKGIPRLGITYGTSREGRMNDYRLYFSYSEGFQPNIGLFDSDGNALDDPQVLDSYEVGIKTEWLNGNIGATLAAYKATQTNVPSSSFTPGTGDFNTNSLEGERKFEGIEFELVGQFVPGWNTALTYAYTEARIHDVRLDGETLAVASVPLHQASLFTSYEFQQDPLRGLSLGAAIVFKDDYPFLDNVTGYYNGGYTDQLLDSGHTRYDLRASYAGFSGPLQGLSCWVNVYNLTDVQFWNSMNGYHQFSIMHGPPRTVTAGISYKFGR